MPPRITSLVNRARSPIRSRHSVNRADPPDTRQRNLIMTTSRWLLGLAFAAAGCGGAAHQPARSATPRPAPSSPAAATQQRAMTNVTIKNFAFLPRTRHVARGMRVRWVNQDQANHTVTFTRGPGDLGNLDPGHRRTVRFLNAGRFAYVCQYHPNMHGTIVVG